MPRARHFNIARGDDDGQSLIALPPLLSGCIMLAKRKGCRRRAGCRSIAAPSFRRSPSRRCISRCATHGARASFSPRTRHHIEIAAFRLSAAEISIDSVSPRFEKEMSHEHVDNDQAGARQPVEEGWRSSRRHYLPTYAAMSIGRSRRYLLLFRRARGIMPI